MDCIPFLDNNVPNGIALLFFNLFFQSCKTFKFICSLRYMYITIESIDNIEVLSFLVLNYSITQFGIIFAIPGDINTSTISPLQCY